MLCGLPWHDASIEVPVVPGTWEIGSSAGRSPRPAGAGRPDPWTASGACTWFRTCGRVGRRGRSSPGDPGTPGRMSHRSIRMSHPEMDSGVVSLSWRLWKLCYLVTDEGIFPMKTHRWLRHIVIRTSGSDRGAHAKPATGTVHAWAARGILILALVLGSVGAVVATSSSHGSDGHANARPPAGNVNRPAGTYPLNSGHFVSMPWMY